MRRAYTVAEIDRMRAALKVKHPPHPEPLWGETVEMYDARAYRYRAMIEDELRTYMEGGVEPSDLEQTLNEKASPANNTTSSILKAQ